jgi:hypothetical protein
MIERNFSVYTKPPLTKDKVPLYDNVIGKVVNSFKILLDERKALTPGVADYWGDWGSPDSGGLIHPDGKSKLITKMEIRIREI